MASIPIMHFSKGGATREHFLSPSSPNWNLTFALVLPVPASRYPLNVTFKPFQVPRLPPTGNCGTLDSRSSHAKYFSYCPQASPPVPFLVPWIPPLRVECTDPKFSVNLFKKYYGFHRGNEFSPSLSPFHSKPWSFSLDLCSSLLGARQWIWGQRWGWSSTSQTRRSPAHTLLMILSISSFSSCLFNSNEIILAKSTIASFLPITVFPLSLTLILGNEHFCHHRITCSITVFTVSRVFSWPLDNSNTTWGTQIWGAPETITSIKGLVIVWN